MCGCLSHAPYWGPGHNPDMYPDWELNQRPFGSQAGAQYTELHQPGRYSYFICMKLVFMITLIETGDSIPYEEASTKYLKFGLSDKSVGSILRCVTSN